MRRTTLILVAVLVVGAAVAPTPAGAQDPATTTTTAAPTTSTTAATVTTTTPTTTSAPLLTATNTSTSAPPTATTGAPASPVPTEGGAPVATTLKGVGDSVFLSAKDETATALTPEFRPAFKAVLAASIAEMTPAARDYVTRNPAVMILGLGNPDVADMDDDYDAPFDAARVLLQAVRNVPCVVWVNIKQDGVNAFYNTGWQADARDLNNWLVEATRGAGLAYDNLHIVDWNRTTVGQPSWFLDDGLHLNQTGQTAYANKIDRYVNRVCPPS